MSKLDQRVHWKLGFEFGPNMSGKMVSDEDMIGLIKMLTIGL